jgi:hypothetical protein
MQFSKEIGQYPNSRQTENDRVFEHVQIDPNDLLEDNHSSEARLARSQWYEEREKNNLMLVWGCADARARILSPHRLIDVSSIATAGSRKPYQRMLNYPGIAGIIVLNHFDGNKLKQGEEPSGCGGVDEFARLPYTEPAPTKRDIIRFIRHEVHDKNVVRNAIKLAAETAKYTDKIVAAALLDHVYGTLYMLGLYNNHGRNAQLSFSLADAISSSVNLQEVFRFGIPVLDPQELPQTFHDFTNEHHSHVTQLLTEFPDFHERQKKQLPKFAVVTTEKIPTRLRYPRTFHDPNTFFQIHVPRDRYDLGIKIDDADIDRVVEQLQYPISHAVLAHNRTNESFSNLQAVLIETGSLMESARIVSFLEADNEWFAQWKALPNHQVLIAQTRAGETTQIVDITKF